MTRQRECTNSPGADPRRSATPATCAKAPGQSQLSRETAEARSAPATSAADAANSDDFDAYIRELVDAAPPLDPGSTQFQRLRAICAPTYARLAEKAA